jgi:hypothetical protein
MREIVFILLAACIAALPFVAFSGWFQTAPRQQAVSLWGDDMKQSGQLYAMPKVTPVSVTVERR